MHPIKGPKSIAAQLSKKEVNSEELESYKRTQINLVRQDSLMNSNNIMENPSYLNVPQPPIIVNYKQPKFSKGEIFIDLCTLALYIYTIYEFIFEFDNLPSRVDVDFGFDSSFEQIDKEYLGLIILGDTVFLILLSILQCFTHKFKYLVEIKQTNCEQIFRYTRYFISSYKLSTMALFMYATISIFNIIDKDWEPYTLYLSSIFSIPFLLFGYIYYRMMKKVDENPFS